MVFSLVPLGIDLIQILVKVIQVLIDLISKGSSVQLTSLASTIIAFRRIFGLEVR